MKRLSLILIVIILLFFSHSNADERIPEVTGTTWLIESNEALFSHGGGQRILPEKFYDYKITFLNLLFYEHNVPFGFKICKMKKKFVLKSYACTENNDCGYTHHSYNNFFEKHESLCYWKQDGIKLTWVWFFKDLKDRRHKSFGTLEDKFLSGHSEWSDNIVEIAGKGINITRWIENRSNSSGTGFFITESGHIVTNNHVVDRCKTINVHYKGEKEPVKVLASDKVNDLAVLESKITPDDVFIISSEDIDKLEDIYVAGFPFGKDVSSNIKITKGIVSSLTGIGDNYSNMQIDAALQPGNSGGPIVNTKGEVVGVAVAKLDFEKVLEIYGNLPENTNFGIKSSVMRTFLKINNIDLPSTSFWSWLFNYFSSSEKVVRDKVDKATVYLECKNK